MILVLRCLLKIKDEEWDEDVSKVHSLYINECILKGKFFWILKIKDILYFKFFVSSSISTFISNK